MINHTSRSVLGSLRSLIPVRRLTRAEGLKLAELQAARFRELTRSKDRPELPETLLTGMPRLRVERRALPTSGLTFWDGESWVIEINKSEPITRQRFTLMHEYKHILDHTTFGDLYGPKTTPSARKRAEQAADYFAGCVLIPKTMLKRAWGAGLQDLDDLARMFGVSERAIEVRLSQTGLTPPALRCKSASSTPMSSRRYYRLAQPKFAALGATS